MSRCIPWSGRLDRSGYGRDGHRMAHRVVYERLVGPIPEGLELDHLCRNRACVNVEHLEPVTHAVNTLRGTSFSAVNARKTHCAHGHQYTAENTYRMPSGGRDCRACIRERQRRCRDRQAS